MWRPYGVGKGKVISYQDIIVKPQGPTDLVVDVSFFAVKEARIHKATSSDDEQSSSLFICSERGCQMCLRNSVSLRVILMLANTAKYTRGPVYGKLRRYWAEEFVTVDNKEETGSALVAHSKDQRDKNEASGSCSDLQLGLALRKPRSCTVHG